MGTRQESVGSDPADDDRAAYDYEGGRTEHPAFVDDLDERIDGVVRFDEYTRQLYATDASAYEVTPIGVVFPRSTADVAAVVSYCAERDTPVLPRGGGTSLAGQAVNRAVVLDFSRFMDDLQSIDPADRRARAQVGVTLGELNDSLVEHDLKFAPDPAWGDKSVLGGAIGNNSTGAHSLKYGKTDAYVEECEVVLADGTATTFGEVSLDELRARAGEGGLEGQIYAAVARLVDDGRDAIADAFPDLKRNVSGYNLDRLIDEAEGGSVNLARLLAGSEGTLAIVTEATVGLEPVPETKSLGLLSYPDLVDAMADVPAILEHDPAAVEVLDDVLLELAAGTEEFGSLVDQLLPEDTGAVLLVEFYADNDPQGKQLVADLLADRVGDVSTDGVPQSEAESLTDDPRRAFDGQEAHDDAERERFWKLRKSGLPILLGRTSDAKHISFIEDTAVPPENLADYVADFRDLLADNDTFASFYAHAGPGCLHIRPLIDTKTVEGIEQMAAIADGATDLVVEYGGSVSGEHGDGRARTQWNRKLYGQDVWERFRDLKSAFDPDWLLNPGQVCGYAGDESIPDGVPARARAVEMTDDLRFDPEYDFDAEFEPALHWDNENGFQGMVELCHGCGGCRGPQETTGGVMCPTYRAADEESTATRGRANALRQAMSGDLPADPTDEEFVDEIMDLCIGCKGCAKDCPSEVDMAKLKTEVEHARHQEHGSSLRSKLFAHIDTVSKWGSRLAPLSNLLARAPGSNLLAERLVGIAGERSVPTFHRESFEDWFAGRSPGVSRETAQRRAVLVPDTYNNYSDPDVLKAAVRVLEAADVHVQLSDETTSSGRAAHSKGFIDLARERARTNVEALESRVADGWDVVLVEPSDAVMFQSDYRDLLGSDGDTVAANAYGLCEFLDRFRLDENVAWKNSDETLTYHGHCHQKAITRDHHAVGVLRRAGYEVDPLDSGCCGMAGSFGYEAEHYSMSQSIGRILFDQIAESSGESVVAPGASCRTQLGDRAGHDSPDHPVERLADAVVY